MKDAITYTEKQKKKIKSGNYNIAIGTRKDGKKELRYYDDKGTFKRVKYDRKGINNKKTHKQRAKFVEKQKQKKILEPEKELTNYTYVQTWERKNRKNHSVSFMEIRLTLPNTAKFSNLSEIEMDKIISQTITEDDKGYINDFLRKFADSKGLIHRFENKGITNQKQGLTVYIAYGDNFQHDNSYNFEEIKKIGGIKK